MIDSQTPYDPFTPFDATSFDKKAYEHWINTVSTYSSIRLYCPKNMSNVRSRILGYSRRYNHILETEKIDDEILNIRYTGRL